MHYTQVINPEQQLQWFNNLDKKCNLYFIIVHRENEIGLINLKDIDWQKKEAEAGIFIGEEDYLNTITPVLATIALMDFSFHILKLKNLKAKINKHNAEAMRFNQSIGYVYSQDIDNGFAYYKCNRDFFSEITGSLRSTLNKFNVTEVELKITSEEMEQFGLDNVNQKDFKVSIL
jgi:RimJ/RimL family protein N-acetyltransferase